MLTVNNNAYEPYVHVHVQYYMYTSDHAQSFTVEPLQGGYTVRTVKFFSLWRGMVN